MIDKIRKKIYKQTIFCPRKYLKIYFFKQSLICLFLILLINLNKRINEHKKGFDVLRSADTSDLPSLKVFNVLQSVEKAMKQRQLSNYTLLSIYLNRSKSYFKVILMLEETLT